MVALNTALVLWVAGVEMDLQAGAQQALLVLRDGLAWDRLQRLSKALTPAEGG